MYLPTIGLEIHAELRTKTKMFCSCRNDSLETKPNVNVCPVCLGHPGTLPVANREAVLSVLRLGLALGGRIPEYSRFARKSYFYPDLPKGYQISQYEEPLVTGGVLSGIRIRRIHLEEDTGRLLHGIGNPEQKIGNQEMAASFVDFNRAGVPLMELVTEPDIKTAEEAVLFAKELQLILRYLGISNADMENGEMRVEANISLNMGTKVEVKNINSFRAVHDAVTYEIRRQLDIVESGKSIIRETRGWNEIKKITESQRTKETEHDYRYFPEPDLPPLDLTDKNFFDSEAFRNELPELPEAKRRRFVEEFGLTRQQAELLVADKAFAEYFEEAISEYRLLVTGQKLAVKHQHSTVIGDQLLYNYLTSDLRGLMARAGISITAVKISPEQFAHFIALIIKKEFTSRLAKELLERMFATGDDPETIVREEGLEVVGETSALQSIVEHVVTKNPKAVSDFQNGKKEALQFLVGKVMAETGGMADPKRTAEILKEIIKAKN